MLKLDHAIVRAEGVALVHHDGVLEESVLKEVVLKDGPSGNQPACGDFHSAADGVVVWWRAG